MYTYINAYIYIYIYIYSYLGLAQEGPLRFQRVTSQCVACRKAFAVEPEQKRLEDTLSDPFLEGNIDWEGKSNP